MNEWVNKIALTPQSGVNCFILFNKYIRENWKDRKSYFL